MKPFYISLKPFLDHHVLPHPTIWSTIFGNNNPLHVEIGFGNGEYIADLKDQRPGINYIGFEEYCDRINKTLRKISRTRLNNVRLLRLDARPGLKFLFAPQSIQHVYCLFPPPWPKKSDIRHRLFMPDFLRLVNSRLVAEGSFKIVTDFHPLADWILEQVPGCGFTVAHKCIKASYNTKFERKWVEGGQEEFDEIVLTKAEHFDIPKREEARVNHYIIEHFNPESFKMAEYSDGDIAVAFKDFLYDMKRERALVYVLVHDEHLVQHVRIEITKDKNVWRVHLAQGVILMPTAGIFKAIECVRDAAVLTGAQCP